MEEENKTDEVVEENDTRLSREEILEASRKENKNGDEREAQMYRKGAQIAYSTGLILTGIIILVSSFLDRLPAELMMVYMAMTAAINLYYGIKTSKRRSLFLACGIVCLITCLFFTVFWILQICGVR